MKFRAILLLAVLLMCSACADQDEITPITSESPADSTHETAEASYLDEIPVYDLSANSIRLAVNSQDDRPNLHTGEENGEVINDAMVSRDRTVSEMFGTQIVYTAFDSRGALSDEINKVVRAGDDVYDFVIGPPGQCIGNLAQGGNFVDLMELEALHTENEWWSQSMNASMMHDGRLYATAGPIALCYLYSPYAFFVNLTMNARYDLADPYQLVTDGKWTIEVMADMMKEAAADLNNDGIMDDADQFGLTTTAEAGKAFYLGCGADMAVKTESGAELLMTDAESIDILDRLHALMSDPASFCTDKDDAKAGDSNYKISFFMQSKTLFAAVPLQWAVLNFRNMEDDYAILPYPKYDETQESYYTHMNSYFPYTAAVPVTNGRLQETGAVMEALAYLSQTTVLPKVNEIVLKEKVARDEQSKAMVELLFSDVKIDLNSIFDFGGSASLLRAYAVGIEDNFMSDYSKIEKKVTKAVERMIEDFSNIDS